MALDYFTNPNNFMKICQNVLSPNINIGGNASSNPELEQKIIDDKASYGRQLGWLLDAMVIIADKVESIEEVQLTKREKLAFDRLRNLKDDIDDMKKVCPFFPKKND